MFDVPGFTRDKLWNKRKLIYKKLFKIFIIFY